MSKAKIRTYKIPITVNRDETGHVSLDIHEDQKELQVEEDEIIEDSSTLLTLTTDIASFNNTQKTISKMILDDGEITKESSILVKKIEE